MAIHIATWGFEDRWTNNEEMWYISRSITAGDETVTMWFVYDAWPPAGETCDGSGVSCRARKCASPVRIEAVPSQQPSQTGTGSIEGVQMFMYVHVRGSSCTVGI